MYKTTKQNKGLCHVYLLWYQKTLVKILVYCPVVRTRKLGKSYQTCPDLSQNVIQPSFVPHIPTADNKKVKQIKVTDVYTGEWRSQSNSDQ